MVTIVGLHPTVASSTASSVKINSQHSETKICISNTVNVVTSINPVLETNVKAAVSTIEVPVATEPQPEPSERNINQVADTETMDPSSTAESPTLNAPNTAEVEKESTVDVTANTFSTAAFSASSLVDHDIVQWVPQILSLLQKNGRMDEDQLLSKLPPLTHTTLMKFTKQTSNAGFFEPNQRYLSSLYILQDVLKVLLALNAIHLEPMPHTDSINQSQPTETQNVVPPVAPYKKRYMFLDGVPRNEYEIIQPKEIYPLIQKAKNEIDRSLERISLLRDFLQGHDTFTDAGASECGSAINHTTSNMDIDTQDHTIDSQMEATNVPTMNPAGAVTAVIKQESDSLELSKSVSVDPLQQTKKAREFLKTLLQRYPEISTDSVYYAALKNFSIDINEKKSTPPDGNKVTEPPMKKRRGRKRKIPEESNPTNVVNTNLGADPVMAKPME